MYHSLFLCIASTGLVGGLLVGGGCFLLFGEDWWIMGGMIGSTLGLFVGCAASRQIVNEENARRAGMDVDALGRKNGESEK